MPGPIESRNASSDPLILLSGNPLQARPPDGM
jgi:hypothetical protein